MAKKDNDTVSTGQASKLCGVTPDTVLKWVKTGRITATRTVGGHYRIHRSSLTPFLASRTDESSGDHDVPSASLADMRCWEFCSRGGEIKEDCLRCVVYNANAEKCYVLARLGREGGHMAVYCKTTCEECEYYKQIRKTISRVLVVSHGDALADELRRASRETIDIRFACCGYEAATQLQHFRPEVVVIDGDFPPSAVKELCKHLTQDPLVAGASVLLSKPISNKQGARRRFEVVISPSLTRDQVKEMLPTNAPEK